MTNKDSVDVDLPHYWKDVHVVVTVSPGENDSMPIHMINVGPTGAEIPTPSPPNPNIPKCGECGHELKYHKVFGCLVTMCNCKVFRVNWNDITTENLEKWK